ncbi:aspartyl/asparaginyl beta-hydroxylase domain-containing protein [Croceibacterium salegens]|uniref:aspartyl/asparaginyl beta-hydroxylase domain-containing protein n=1 Tax=Croceibacterium salegens TaxID=1737568 RepID=UPI001F2A7CB8|nr:aspartyl/asparaginyl beta-hydroxylase domain-containing protein [Croceibacterium salegens]
MIGDDKIVPAEVVPGLAALQPHWQAIRDELEPLLAAREAIPSLGDISPDHKRIAPGQHWKSYFFKGYGFRSDENLAQCPLTAELIEQVPGLVVAFFSIMEPGTHVPRHRGLTKAWLNCHLPLRVPKGPGRCEIDVGGTMCQWREGEWLVFDETNEHEVWNESEELRAVLFLQVRRPMTRVGRAAAGLLFQAIRHSPFVQDVKQEIGAR